MLSRFPGERTRLSLALALLASVVLVGLVSVPPSAAKDDHHDQLEHRKSAITGKIENHQHTLDEVSGALVKAKAKVDTAKRHLAAARDTLHKRQQQVRDAEARDRRMQKRLDVAIQRLKDARDDLARGQQQVRQQRDDLASYVVRQYQSGGGNLSSLSVAFGAADPQQAVEQMSVSDAVMDKQDVRLQRLQATRVLLRLTKERVARNKEKAAQARQDAAEHLAHTRDLKKKAADAAHEVAQRVTSLKQDRSDLAAQKKKELRRLANLKRERQKVESKLKAIAEARERARKRREAERRREAAQQRRAEQRRAEQRQAEQRRAEQRREAQQEHSASSGSSGGSTNDGGYLSMPVHIPTYVTSPYGRRFHPILHVWKLHDGTDLHAPCGTPIYAAASGRVTSEYYNSAYGNRLFIDHGVVNGVSLTTSYQHLSSYVASVGEHVNRGELIAYAGGTGWVTACHLHFMVFVNGHTVNPMSWL